MTPYQEKQMDPTPQNKYTSTRVDGYSLQSHIPRAIEFLQGLLEEYGPEAIIELDVEDSYSVVVSISTRLEETPEQAERRVELMTKALQVEDDRNKLIFMAYKTKHNL